jgi:hydrogenase/urease accessory protein HupE
MNISSKVNKFNINFTFKQTAVHFKTMKLFNVKQNYQTENIRFATTIFLFLQKSFCKNK